MFSSRMEFPLLFLFVFFCSFLSECKGEEPFKPASTCARLECPQYSVVYTDKDFEIRSYKEAVWVSSPNIEANSYKEGASKGFLKLLDYFVKGYNLQHVTLKMTAPVLVDIQNSTYTTHFYVPEKYQKNVPQPISKDIKPEKLPKYQYAAVRRFSGFPSSTDIPKEVDALKKSLLGSSYKRAAILDHISVAGYNSPRQFFNRVNEVIIWFD